MVEDFEWIRGRSWTEWTANGSRIRKQYPTEIGSAVPLDDSSGVALVEPRLSGASVVVFNADGSERFRLSASVTVRDGVFYQIYYSSGRLTAIAHNRSGDRAVELDEADGAVLRVYETR